MAATHADEGNDPVRAARAALRIERRRTVDEREALRAFRGRVSSIPDESVSTGPSDASGGDGFAGVRGLAGGSVKGSVGGAGRGTASPGSRLVAVRDAYRATVMSVPHYEAEYDDTYERSVVEEFGPELAYALTRTDYFHEEYKRSLLSAAETAVQEREAFLDALESETESVERAESRLDPIRTEIEAIRDELGGDAEPRSESDDETEAGTPGFGALDACRTRIEALHGDCDRIAARRQRVLAEHERRLALSDDVDLPAYCYQDLDVTYPVLAAVGSVGERLDGLRDRIERAMARTR
ncbi:MULTISPECIES: DUF7260 family protein [Halorubrum]|uniref:DUF7260 domain-containing protein n=1 Tax=Halorubrum sodomense TaxID=35743 RepID=A0A1I6HRF8_HALSD|nr:MULTISPECIES: hypothetical protein [Halorubrum]TKX55610.1 hypothetical protein EXE42_03865 [Halorubrum sp. SP3]TKX68373.1 hypothetical protein EXE45_11660 [Halorubrum sp. SP9]SFR57071.1 hypothetical protein SAMN04487937_2847 [Halorubrum sodomense]